MVQAADTGHGDDRGARQSRQAHGSGSRRILAERYLGAVDYGKKIREMWGFADPPGTTMMDLFKARYRGIRVSFGYPACPRLEDQEQLFCLLDVSKHIGVHLTEGFMMEPEGSVSALVLHHPEAKYFNLSPEDIERLERAVEKTRPPKSAPDLLHEPVREAP